MDFSIIHAANESPEQVALIIDGQPIRYATIASDVARAANWLDHAIIDRSRVGFSATLQYDVLVMIYAALELGITLVPLHPAWTAAERRQRLAIAGVFELLDVSRSGWSTYPDQRPERAIPHSATALVIFTSGSTGLAKGVELSRGACRQACEASAANLGWMPEDRWLLNLSVAHIGGMAIVLRCLAARRTLVIQTARCFDAAQTMRSIERDGVTLLSLVPTQLDRLLTHRPQWNPPPTVRAILIGGAPLIDAQFREARARGWPILLTYGMTETGSQVATQRFGCPADTTHGVGPPLPGFELRIVGGQIEIRGAALFTRYCGEATARSPEDWFRTGDLGTVDPNGFLHVYGRADELIISGGEKVAPAEVETVLLRDSRIRQAVVFGLADATWGEAVVAVIVPATDVQLSDRAVKQICSEQLAPYKHPRQILLLPELPVTANGKVDRAKLKSIVRARAGQTVRW